MSPVTPFRSAVMFCPAATFIDVVVNPPFRPEAVTFMLYALFPPKPPSVAFDSEPVAVPAPAIFRSDMAVKRPVAVNSPLEMLMSATCTPDNVESVPAPLSRSKVLPEVTFKTSSFAAVNVKPAALVPLVMLAVVAAAALMVAPSILPSALTTIDVALATVTVPPNSVNSAGVAAESLPLATFTANEVADAAVTVEPVLSVYAPTFTVRFLPAENV